MIKRDFIVTELNVRGAACTAAALYVDNHLEELEIERNDRISRVDSIVMACVDKKAENIGGAFLRIGKSEPAFSNDIRLKGQSLLPVQIRKDAHGHKSCTVSSKLNIPGVYTVVSFGKTGLSCSSKLNDAQKSLLREALAGSGISIDGFQVMLRTNAGNLINDDQAEISPLLEELTESMETLKRIRKESSETPAFKVLYEPAPFYVRMLKHLPVRPDRIRSDIPSIASKIGGELYEDRILSLASLKNLKSETEKLLNRHINLKSGAEIVIDRTEAMTCIDINSGKNIKGKEAQKTYKAINQEAIAEILRQLRLRNISGMVVVDLIKMTDKKDDEELLMLARKLCRRETIYTEAVDISGLGLLELMRQKKKASLWETICD